VTSLPGIRIPSAHVESPATGMLGDVPDVFSRIICGVDGSDAGLEAIRQALRLGAPGGSVLAIGVSETHLAVHAGMFASQITGELDVAAETALEEAAALGPAIETRLVRGHAPDALIHFAGEEQATLVAIGSHGKRRGPGMILGNVATRMLHDAPCSVLLARPPEEAERFPRSIVVGIDGSEPSLGAAAAAQALAERSGAPLTFLAARGARQADIETERLENRGLDVNWSEEMPLPALLAASQQTDLLVVGSRGLRGLRALGSVSERIGHRAHCSVLVVREPG
jgi:nucleotide-binding universal stress UspA family protein